MMLERIGANGSAKSLKKKSYHTTTCDNDGGQTKPHTTTCVAASFNLAQPCLSSSGLSQRLRAKFHSSATSKSVSGRQSLSMRAKWMWG